VNIYNANASTREKYTRKGTSEIFFRSLPVCLRILQ